MKAGEAAKYRCPMAISAGNNDACLGKDCAAWRWLEPKFGSVDSRRGYCGMAAEPKYPLNPDNGKQG